MKKLGFTLIELVIAISVIAVVVGIFLANYSGQEPQSQLINVTSNLMRDLRLVQAKDAANNKYGGATPVGWGINFVSSSSSYSLFADLNGDRHGTSTESLTAKGGRVVTLPTGIIISAVGSINPATFDIIFFHNDDNTLYTYITDGAVSFESTIQITLTETETGVVKHIYVNPLGLIYSDL